MTTITLIVAAAENGVIGLGGRLPWRMPSDLKTFRRLTLGKPIIMGRKTFQSIGKALDGRDNLVVTRDMTFHAAEVEICRSLEAALLLGETRARARGVDEIMVIGGAEIYRQALHVAGRIYLTRIHARPDGDASFPAPDPINWRLVGQTPIGSDPRDEFSATLETYERMSPVAS